MDDSYSFGAWVRRRRKALDLTQADLAQMVGMATVTIHKIETDERRPSHAMAERLLQILGVSPNEREALIRAARGLLPIDALTNPSTLTAASMLPLTNLPAPVTPLIGRQAELAVVSDLLADPTIRLLTLTGPGGVGKTRLALVLAASQLRSFPDGVWLIEAASLSEATQLVPAIAHTIGLLEPSGAAAVEPLQTRLLRYLAEHRLLLVLDNLEHLAAGVAPLLHTMLDTAPQLLVLATSRAPLRLVAEHEYPVPLLAVPPVSMDEATTSNDLTNYDAVSLLLERAQAVRPDFVLADTNADAVATLCRQLDGLPLAIELAAARLRLYTPAQLVDRLAQDGSLTLLGAELRDLPARQQTLRATIDWSYGLLTVMQQTLLARLSVFAGSFTLVAAEAVCANDTDPARLQVAEALEGLLTLSLVQGAPASSEPRFWLLETVRAFASERLAMIGESEALRTSHLAYYVRLTSVAEPQLRSAAQGDWLIRLDAEEANLDAALRWALANAEAPDERRADGLRLAGGLWYYWLLRSRGDTVRRWLLRDAAWDVRLPASLRARALLCSVYCGFASYDELMQANTAGMALALKLDDPWLLALGSWQEVVDAARVNSSGWIPLQVPQAAAWVEASGDGWLRALHAGALDPAQQDDAAAWIAQVHTQLAMARATGDALLISETLGQLAHALLFSGQLTEAVAVFQEAIALGRTRGLVVIIWAHLRPLAIVYALLLDLQAAWSALDEALLLARRAGLDYAVVSCLFTACHLHWYRGDYQALARTAEELWSGAEPMQDAISMSEASGFRSQAAYMLGDYARARSAAEEGRAHNTRFGIRGVITDFAYGQTLMAIGDQAAAIEVYTQAVAERRLVASGRHMLAINLAYLGCAQLHAGAPVAARTSLEEALTLARALSQRTLLPVVSQLGRLELAEGDSEAAARHLAEGLKILRRLENRGDSADLLEWQGMAALQHGQPQRAVRWWGAAAALRAATAVARPPVDQPEYERRMAEARAALGVEHFTATLAAGKRLNWAEALDEAIGWPSLSIQASGDEP